MDDIKVIKAIQEQKNKQITEDGKPNLDEEHINVMEVRKMTLDEPPFFRKQDPLR